MNNHKVQDAKKFLTKNFIYLFFLTSFFVFIIGAIISTLNLRSIERIYSTKIRENIELQRNEFLNEIAINDESAIKEHLASLLTELQVDSVELELNNQKINMGTATASESKQYLFSLFLGTPPSIHIIIANEFSNLKANLSVNYGVSFENFIVFPFLRSAMWMLLISLIPVSLVFIILFGKVDKMLIQPLRKITTGLSSTQSEGIKDIQANSLAEISSLVLASKRFQEIERRIVFSELASQVSHDIRSPLSALNMVTGTLTGLPEEKRLIIRAATQRINDIANQLLQKSKPNVDHQSLIATEPIMLSSLLDTIISEKRVQYRDNSHINIQSDLAPGFGLFSAANSTELSRAISNLINNSVEASPGICDIKISLNKADLCSVISVQDKGRGIPPHILAKLGERGLSYGKDNLEQGFGLGIYHAKVLVEGLGGRFEIISRIERGTTINIFLPIVAAPDWFAQSIAINHRQTVVVVDDDSTIHQIWKGRFKNCNLKSFSSPKSLSEWLSSARLTENSFFLVDFEFLGSEMNGLDLIDKLNIGDRSLLVTSRYDEAKLREYAKSLGVKILPKGMAYLIPIEVSTAYLERRKEFSADVTSLQEPERLLSRSTKISHIHPDLI